MYILLNLSKRAIKRYQEYLFTEPTQKTHPHWNPTRKPITQPATTPIPNKNEKTHPI
jgi:hypothetical protein